MRHTTIALALLLGSLASTAPALAGVSVGIGVNLPGVSIGINLPGMPQLVPVPGYPVYYAPQLASNYFFYDGLYWVCQGDDWYASNWYNGPWNRVGPERVPLYLLRVPVRYYRNPPPYFRGWRADAPPRWGEHWGPQWEAHRNGWDHWDRNAAPRRAPLPGYQRQYSGDHYPAREQQPALQDRNYRFQPHDVDVREHAREHGFEANERLPDKGTPESRARDPRRGQGKERDHEREPERNR